MIELHLTKKLGSPPKHHTILSPSVPGVGGDIAFDDVVYRVDRVTHEFEKMGTAQVLKRVLLEVRHP